MKKILIVLFLCSAQTIYAQKIKVSNAVANEGQELIFEITLEESTDPFIVDCKVEDITSTSASKEKKKGDDKNRMDYYEDYFAVSFKGEEDEKQYVSVRTRADGDTKETDEKLALVLSINGKEVARASGVIKNVICRHCPSESFLEEYKDKSFKLDFYGDGNIQSTVTDGDQIPANTGLGVSAVKHFPDMPRNRFLLWYRIDLAATINVASNVDTLVAITDGEGNATNDNIFGNSILTPLNSGQAVNLSLTLYNKNTLLGIFSGFEMKYIGSNRTWQLNQDNYSINTNMFRVGTFHEFVPYDKREDFSVRVKFSGGGNWLNGDIFNKNEGLLKRFIGIDKPNYAGYEFGLDFRLKNIVAEFAYTTLTNSAGDVRGLTDGRIVTTIRFVGGFGLNLDKTK